MSLYYTLFVNSENSPSIHIALIHKPGEFPLREQSVVEIEPSVFPDVGLAQPQGIDYPVVLLITVVVLCGAERMGHILNAVYNGAGKVIRGVHPRTREQEMSFVQKSNLGPESTKVTPSNH